MDSDNTPTSLYVYKGEGGFFTNDKIVKDVDKANVQWVPQNLSNPCQTYKSFLFSQLLPLPHTADPRVEIDLVRTEKERTYVMCHVQEYEW